MEHAQIQSSDGAQVMTLNGQQLQVLQMNNAPHMIQGPNGQQIVVHAVPSSAPAIQVKFHFVHEPVNSHKPYLLFSYLLIPY